MISVFNVKNIYICFIVIRRYLKYILTTRSQGIMLNYERKNLVSNALQSYYLLIIITTFIYSFSFLYYLQLKGQ